MTVTQRADYQTAVLVFKSLHGLAPNYLNLFSNRIVEHDHCLRSSLQNNILSVPNVRGNVLLVTREVLPGTVCRVQ